MIEKLLLLGLGSFIVGSKVAQATTAVMILVHPREGGFQGEMQKTEQRLGAFISERWTVFCHRGDAKAVREPAGRRHGFCC